MNKPLLSICIPTYNRARYLNECLRAVAGQVMAMGDDVELIISDNNSTDNTADIVQEATASCHIKYSKNEVNIGAVRNIIKIINEKAIGEYCWIIGDDDLIKPGGVQKIFSKLKTHNDLDYFYINYSLHKPTEKERILNSTGDALWSATGSRNINEGRVDNWNSLIAEDSNGLTPIYASVFRRSSWLKHAGSLNIQQDFDNVESTYPHTVIFTKMMTGKPAWRSGRPWVSMFTDQESWSAFVPVVVLYRFNELLDLMEKNGVARSLLKRHRRRMANLAGKIIFNILLGVNYKNLTKTDAIKFLLRRGWNINFIRSFLSSLKNKIFRRSLAS